MQAIETNNFNKQKKLENERAKFKIKCEHCGHIIVMTFAERTICSHCGHWVYKNDALRFKYEMLKKLRKVNDDRNTKKSNEKVFTKS